MADEPENTTTPIQSVWAQRCTQDLEANRKEQSALTAQISSLRQRLAQLRQDEEWLVGAQGMLPTLPAAGEAQEDAAPADDRLPGEGSEDAAPATAAEAASPVPQPRQEEQAGRVEPEPAARKKAPAKAKTSARKSAPAKKSATARKTAAARKTATADETAAAEKAVTAGKATAGKTTAGKTAAAKKSTTKSTARKTAAARGGVPEARGGEAKQPPLHQLVLDVLLRTPGEPRLAREVHDEVVKAHPERATASLQTVRNSLDALFKKKVIDKANQQGSVMYSAKAGGADTAGAEGEPEPAAAKEPVQA
ncbi:hypothetical protein ACF061_12790 [Streptomyces sp. NPDC015220]|uniref:hypothetical protein n=1 Tax=Streptomyces sp. NPDC015220 TaxID=3364947 RepID=UPI0037006E0E